MKKNYLSLILLICALNFGFGQIITFDFNGLAGNEVSANSNFNDANLNVSTITRGSGLTAANNGGRFNAINWALTNITNAIAGDNYMEFTITPNSGYQFDVTSIDVNFQRSGTGTRGILLRSSLDGYAADIDTEKSIADNTSVQTFTFTVGQTGNNTAVTYRIYGWAEATGGSGGFEGTGNDIVVNGTVNSTATNTTVQFDTPTSTLTEDGLFIDVCASITNPSATNATTVDITLDGASTATNGTDYDDGTVIPAAIIFPQTLTFPANSGADQCLTIYISNDDLLIEGNETVVLNLTNPTGGDSAALGTDTQHVLTITDNDAAFPADVVITEIMYNSAGADDEWIEICNVSGSTQVLNDYTIEVGGVTVFTFPSTGVLIAGGTCITVALGDSGDATFNPDCPFTPDYTNGAGTGTLNNTSDTITLTASDGSTVVDTVTYNSADGGNTDSLHVIDISLDNSATSTNYWEVINGGSPGVNSLISPCTPIGPEINVEGTTANFPDIADGDVTPAAFDGTDFGDVPVFGTSTNTFRIENFGGTQNLTITSVTVVSGDVGDFSISALPSSPIAPADPNGFSNFDIEFSPITIGVKTAVIQIISNDADENPYTFTVEGNAECVANAITATPNSGPINTVVTVTGTNLSTATASFNGLPATVNNISATVMEVTVPSGAISGNLEIIDDLGCPGSTPFTIINSQISSCEGSSGTTPTDLFISEVTDANSGGLTYIEIFNGTGVTINLDNYSIQFFNNGSATQNGGLINLNNVNLATGNTYIVGVSAGSTCTGITGADGSLADQTGFGGVNFGVNSDDHIRLYDGTTHVDSWGTYLSNTWADALGIGSEGVVFTRNNNAPNLPDPNFSITDWAYVDWASCADNDYSDVGNYDFSTGTPPTVNSISSTTTACNEVTISVSATEGFVLGNALAYYWYAFDPANAGLGWQAINNGGIYTTNTSSPDLIISDPNSVLDFQFYCQVRENDATCYTASNAIKISYGTATWDGTNWIWNDGTPTNTLPTLITAVVIDGDYDTSAGGVQVSFEACSLIVNSNYSLTVSDGDYVEIESDVTVEDNASILISTQGAFVQNGIGALAGSFTLNGTGTSQVNKFTAPLANWYDYTYWSSPVANADIDVALSAASANRRFYFNASNYLDTDGNDIDDNDDDWTLATGSGNMVVGRGYAATHNNLGFIAGLQYQYNFEGALNTGDYNVPLAYNPLNITDHWNLVGNPYPSAIRVRGTDGLFDFNTGVIKTAIYLWSHDSPPLDSNPGNEVLNFNTSDYAIINGTMSIPGASGITPGNYIPSGQSFFVSSLSNTNLVFNNAMRISGSNSNDLFFRGANTTDSDTLLDEARLWLNLISEDGLFSAIGVGYVENATDGFDDIGYDARRISSENEAIIYSLIENNTDKFAIQGKSISSLDENEIIPLGFRTTIEGVKTYTISLYDFEGTFLTNNPIYIKDYMLNITHNLKDSDYNFTATSGEFNNRFEIVFTPQALSVNDNTITANDIIITELNNGEVQIKVSEQHTIEHVEILDVLGRQVYSLKGNSSVEVYNLSKLSNAAYIAKVTLSNGQVISKKAIKQR